jgi:hypothetical protein
MRVQARERRWLRPTSALSLALSHLTPPTFIHKHTPPFVRRVLVCGRPPVPMRWPVLRLRTLFLPSFHPYCSSLTENHVLTVLFILLHTNLTR